MPIRLEKRGAVAVLTIDNGRLNLLTPALHKEMLGHLQEFLADPALRVGVLTGAPGSSFCAGDNIKLDLPKLPRQEQLARQLDPAVRAAGPLARPGFEQDVVRLERLKPIIGAVDGYCLGQGMIYLLLLTDIRVATPGASFGLPEIAYGMGGAGGLTRLGRQVPHVAAMWLMLTGERIDAAKALHWNLINEIVPPEALLARAMAIAERVAAHPPLALRVEMEAYQRCMDSPREQAIAQAAALFRLQMLGGATEGVVPEFLKKGKGEG
ncbi:MAG: enoyl-CoA hydratase/isomerase family protein [Alphaproteobacteria bacterium]|nr:enoyl-CoA hydratase/isomerase family protein [Alphaproteobacteria bacterium]